MYGNISLEILRKKLLSGRVVDDTRWRMGRLQCLLPSRQVLEVSVDGSTMSACLADRRCTVILADATATLDNPADSLAFVLGFIRKHTPGRK